MKWIDAGGMARGTNEEWRPERQRPIESSAQCSFCGAWHSPLTYHTCLGGVLRRFCDGCQAWHEPRGVHARASEVLRIPVRPMPVPAG